MSYCGLSALWLLGSVLGFYSRRCVFWLLFSVFSGCRLSGDLLRVLVVCVVFVGVILRFWRVDRLLFFAGSFSWCCVVCGCVFCLWCLCCCVICVVIGVFCVGF